MDADSKPSSPYVGLVPYSAYDALFFFGRETETEIISANLRSARLTVLYGTSGVGKSSVLQAGVVHNLRKIARQDLKTYGQAEFAVVTYRKWAGDPIKGIVEAVREAVADSLQIKFEMLEPVPETKDFVKILQSWSHRYGLELLIILDQFEELFNYLKDKNSLCAIFAEQLAQAVKAPDLSVRFLISLRGDTLSLLDYFKETIPGLFDNRLELRHLTAPNAKCAITKPIDAYNDLYKPEPKFSIEPHLIDEVIEQIKVGQVENVVDPNLLITGNRIALEPNLEDSAQIYIETPYLQLVMKRIWQEEVQVGSNTLHLKTLTEKLGGAKKVIQTHLDEVMNTLTDEERQIASKCFKYLVTPIGTKVALTPVALAKYTEWDEKTIEAVLKLLFTGKENNTRSLDINLPVSEQKAAITSQPPNESRVLRPVEIAVGKKRLQGYEVTHDAYIPAILDWRARYVIEHSVLSQLKAKTKKALPIMVGILIFILGSFLIWRCNVNSEFKRVLDDAEASNSNRQELQAEKAIFQVEKKDLENELTNQNQNALLAQSAEKQAKEALKDDQNTAYKDLISILISLSESSAAERDSAIKKLKKLIVQKKVPKDYESSIIQIVAKIDNQKADELRDAALNKKIIPNSDLQTEPRIYIHITDEGQRKAVQPYKRLLERNDFNVPGIENVGNINLTITQIRYFQKDDQSLAEKVAQLLKGEGVENIRAQYVSGYEDSTKIRPKHLEIWFATNAFPILTP